MGFKVVLVSAANGWRGATDFYWSQALEGSEIPLTNEWGKGTSNLLHAVVSACPNKPD